MPTPSTRVPNIYNLHSNVIQGGQWSVNIAYSTGAGGSIKDLHYQDPFQTINFSGDALRIVDTEIGSLVTVTIRMTVDTGSTGFTLFVPRINLGQSTETQVSTFGVTTVHRFSIVPAFNEGQTEIYSVTELIGTAKWAVF
jgi:hypothetical protein